MKLKEISKPQTTASLNESLAKTFGQRINVDAFTLEQLQDARNKIRTELSQIETNESLFANLLKKENLPFEKFLDIEKRQKEGQELKKRIEDGHIPDEPPIRGYKRVDQQWVPLTEEEADELEVAVQEMFESGDITIDPSDLDDDDFIDEEIPQPMPGIQKQDDGGNKIMSRICKLFSRK